jgi:1-acyl-sn-glycerol-3-phosphate acyltransferase
MDASHRTRRALARAALSLGGWTPDGAPPDLPKYVVLAAPHTTLADGVWMQTFAWYWGLDVDWLVKSSTTRGPAGPLLKKLGAIPVERSAPQGLIDQLAREFASRARMRLVIAPEGTRARRTHWKSGFYHLARQAGVPVCLSYLDYRNKRGGFGPCFSLTGNVRADMDRIRSFYRDVMAARPSDFTPPRLREEDEGSEARPT